MKIIGITVVRNEADIVAQMIRHAAQHLDLLLVVDSGSTDDTAVQVRQACSEAPHTVFLGTIEPHHPEQVRRHIWHHFRPHLSRNDWWMIADADEFVEDGVRQKVERATAENADHIFSRHVNFYYTQSEANEWQAGRETLADRTRPIEERRLFYRMHTSQVRLFRHLPWLRWNEDTFTPQFLSKFASERVVFRHYQYRDIPQIEERIALRRQWKDETALMEANPHWLHDQLSKVISADGPPLEKVEEGQDFKEDPHMTPLPPAPGAAKTWLKYARAAAYSLTPQAPATLLNDINVPEIMSCIKR